MSVSIHLSEIPRTSPSLWSHMRRCRLRAALAAASEADRWVLHDPRGWLGTTFHRVMEAARAGASAADTQKVWDSTVDKFTEAARRHPLDMRFGAPQRWPSYYLVRQRSLALAAEKGGKRVGQNHGISGPQFSQRSARGAERRLEARQRRLV